MWQQACRLAAIARHMCHNQHTHVVVIGVTSIIHYRPVSCHNERLLAFLAVAQFTQVDETCKSHNAPAFFYLKSETLNRPNRSGNELHII